MKLFVLSIYCASRTRCQKCRDRSFVGDAWRDLMRRNFTMPEGGERFECPHGILWGYFPPEKIPEGMTPEQAAEEARLKRCCDPVPLNSPTPTPAG